MVKKILLTGASGFIGSACVRKLMTLDEYLLRIILRKDTKIYHESDKLNIVKIVDMSVETLWHGVLENCHAIIHTAARVHVFNEHAVNAIDEYRRINVAATLNFARQAAAAGVKRFIFISSIKVNGESTLLNKPFRPDDLPNPSEPYALSKYEAEQGLLALSAETGMEVVIIRPPLVYGPGVKGNYKNMMQWLYKGIPLPFKQIKNKRSFVSLDNLVDIIVTCIDHPNAANQIFLASDGHDLSTPELIRKISHLMNKPCRLISIPRGVLELIARLLGKSSSLQRLHGSLCIDSSKLNTLLGWEPNQNSDAALEDTVADFLISYNKSVD